MCSLFESLYKECVFSFFLKIASVDEFLVFRGRRFHSFGSAMENDLSPSVLYDLINVPDLSARCGSYFTFTSSWMYEGAIEWTALKVIKKIL